MVRGAFPGFRDPVSPNDLAGFACEEGVDSRLVLERGGTKPWQVIHGPQKAARLRRLPASHWTLLVQGMDRLVPAAAELMEPFRFIPDWRLDDVMVSFAPRHGTVGPHVDNYDVFLLQGKGRRRWRIDTHASADFRPGLDLRILQRFRPEQEWILEPGDMLYLPPGVGHHGVALEDCLTYSIGFRAPSVMDLLAAVLARFAQAPEIYKDPGLQVSREPGEISKTAMRDLRAWFNDRLRRIKGADFDALVGEMLTEPKERSGSSSRPVSQAALRSRILGGLALERSPGSRVAFLRRGRGVDVFADGRCFPLARGLAFAAPLITRERTLLARLLIPHLKNREFVRLLTELTNAGVFRWGRPALS